MVDKNLFLYDLAVVAIMKDEEPYVKEWLDYHLLAGVDHFYIYDNDSKEEFKKILQPYIDAEIVTYTFFPGKGRQYECYNDAFKRFKFECRYMAFIDADEFIFPKSNPTIAEVVDEILLPNPNAAALGANWIFFGSNNLEKADYNVGVLDRFTYRETNVDSHIKTIANPRMINFFMNPHYANYFDGRYSVNENGKPFLGPFNEEKTADKIQISHYHTKSAEEWAKKVERGTADNTMKRDATFFSHENYNDEEDDGILKYRDERKAALMPDGNISTLLQLKQINYPRLLNAISLNLFQTVILGTPPQFFSGKMDNFLTCLSLSAHLRGKVLDETGAKFFEEAALNAIHKTLYAGGMAIADIMLLIGEMPKILKLNYPAVKNIRDALLQIIPQILEVLRLQSRWQEFTDLEYKLEMLKTFKIN